MELRPIQTSDINLVVGWLSQELNYQWLDFGNGLQSLSPALLRLMSQNEKHCLRLYGCSEASELLGIVALSNVDKNFKTALLWYVLGNKAFARLGHTTRAVHHLLDIGFSQLGLQSVNAWTVETNRASVRVLEKNAFRYIGKQRSCHVIQGARTNRLHFDLIAEEYNALGHKAA